MEKCRSILKTLTGKPTGDRFLGRVRRRWEDHIRLYLKEIGFNTEIELIRVRIGSLESLL